MNHSNYHGVVIFSTDLSKQLEDTHRLPPTSIGVRRVRPSRKVILNALHRDARSRRKKRDKIVHNDNPQQECCENPFLKPLEISESSTSHKKLPPSSTLEPSLNDSQVAVTPSTDERLDLLPKSPLVAGEEGDCDQIILQRNRYYQLEKNTRLLEEEIMELKGMNSAIMPVFLSPPMALQARCLGILPSVKNNELANQDITSFEPEKRKVEINDDLASHWAKLLKLNMSQAETDREKEQMRPMAYTLIPEVWSRLRPISNTTGHPSVLDSVNFTIEPQGNSSIARKAELTLSAEMRPASSRLYHDKNLDVIFQCLYIHFPKLHISCGVKFGCDYLLYDGCRQDRHAFAGLRVCVATQGSQELPLPTAFDLAGYVRVLNTAGKLALLATIKEVPITKQMDKEEERKEYHVAFVDLALEKVLTAASHQRKTSSRKRGGKRKEVGLHLDKRKK